MTIIAFPPLESADKDGLLAVGGDLEVDSLLLAYRSGIFPWPLNDELLAWFSPPRRTVLFTDKFHLSRSLLRKKNKKLFTFRLNTCFEEVIRQCANSKNRSGPAGTWITSRIIEAYLAFHKAGYAHSIECFKDDQLVGGLYGVSIGKMFAGESMFYLEPDASKLCLDHLITYLIEHDCKWMDCQVMTPHMKQMGAQNISRKKFLVLLETGLADKDSLF